MLISERLPFLSFSRFCLSIVSIETVVAGSARSGLANGPSMLRCLNAAQYLKYSFQGCRVEC